MGWAKIRGAFVLSRRNIARIIAALSAAILSFHAAATALAPGDEALMRKVSAAMCRILPVEDSLPSGEVRIAVSDQLFADLAEVFFRCRHLLPGCKAPSRRLASPIRRYSARKALTVSRAAAITGLSESTIKRLDKAPGNSNYPGRNSTPQILAAWARLYRNGKVAAREVRAANRPALGRVRC